MTPLLGTPTVRAVPERWLRPGDSSDAGTLGHVLAVDAGVALAAGVAQVAGTWLASAHQTGAHHRFDAGAGALLAFAAGAVALRRLYPVLVLATVFAATLAYVSIGYPGGPIWAALIIAFGTAVYTGHRLAAGVSLIAGYPAFGWFSPWATGRPGAGVAEAIGLAAWLLVLAVAAEGIRLRRVQALETARRRDEQARRRVSDERLRIARELHDVIAHNISLINVQAATTLHLLDEQGSPATGPAEHERAGAAGERARDALAVIKQVSRETLAELRSVLGTLRLVDDPGAPHACADGLQAR